jgi:hypothetical protein
MEEAEPEGRWHGAHGTALCAPVSLKAEESCMALVNSAGAKACSV